jgi:hypothetical protein
VASFALFVWLAEINLNRWTTEAFTKVNNGSLLFEKGKSPAHKGRSFNSALFLLEWIYKSPNFPQQTIPLQNAGGCEILTQKC